MSKFQIIRVKIKQEFETEKEAEDMLQKVWQENREKIEIADFEKKEIHLIDKSVLKVIEVKN